jgi:hypothetical protein
MKLHKKLFKDCIEAYLGEYLGTISMPTLVMEYLGTIQGFHSAYL